MTPPPLLRDQRKTDAEHLKLLAIFHFVIAGLTLLSLGFLYVQYRLTAATLLAEGTVKPSSDGLPPEQVVRFLGWFNFALGAADVVTLIGNVLSGFFIRRRKYRTFSFIIAVLNCLRLSLGAVLGIFTIVVLLRNSVRELYAEACGALPAAGGPSPAPPKPLTTPDPMSLIPPEQRAPSVPPPLVAEPQGDATGGIIPYKNPQALTAYYCGVFSIIPFFGFFIGIAALCLGIAGLKKRKQTPVIRGSVHAWIGIICGGLSIAVHLLLVILFFASTRR